MKRGFALSFFIFLFAAQMLFVSGQEIPGLPSQLTPESIEQQQQRIMELQNVSNWQLLGTRFQQAMLKNPVVADVNSFFEKFSIVFSILFGMPYSLSITLLFVIALWIIVVFDGGHILKTYFHLSQEAYAFSGGFAIILAQLKIFVGIVNGVGTFIFSRESWWARSIAIIIAILAIAFFHVASKLYTKYLVEKRKKEEEREAHLARQEEITYAKAKKKGKQIAEE